MVSRVDNEVVAGASAPSRKVKFFFWLILGIFSTVLAEVTIGSTFFPLFLPAGILIILPVYMAHSVVLGTIVFRWGRPTLPALVSAGMLFGLYEAYITQVLWYSFTGTTTFTVGGVAVFDFLLLVPFWHAWFAFIVPLALAERGLSSSRAIVDSLPSRMRSFLERRGKIVTITIAALLGLLHGANAPEFNYALFAGPINGAALLFFVVLFRRFTKGARYSMASLLPKKKGFIGWCLFLALIYVIAIVRGWDALPSMAAQATIWSAYAVAIGLLVVHLRKSRTLTAASHETTPTGKPFERRLAILVVVVFSVLAALTSFLLPPFARSIFSIVIGLSGIVVGVVVSVRVVHSAFHEKPKSAIL